MAAPPPRNPWPAAAAAASVAALAGLGLALAGVPGPWVLIAGGLVVLALAAALAALAAARHGVTLLDAALARAATAEHERNQLERDIHRHDQLEQQLLHAKQAAEAAALAKGEFLATMSHEIRTPLNGIIPMLELIAHGTLAPDQREMLRTAHESSQQLLRIVDDILDYSKLEANRLELEITSFNLREPLEAMLQLMRRPAEGKGLRLELQIDPNVRLPVRGDPVRLRQVLGNLVGNAVKFTERGGVTLSVRRLGETPVQHLLRFEVRDTGIGIGDEQQARLFRAFSQADASTTRLYGGTGLGLAICKRIVDLMGGTIGVHSEPGQGSTFWFEVPLLKVIGDLQGSAAAGETLRRVLVVSPDVRLRQRMALMLPNWGLTATTVATPQEALDRLRGDVRPGQVRGGYAMLVADYDGLRHTARALRRALNRTPAYADVRLLWLYSDEEVPMELRDGASLLPRQAPDAALRLALQGGPVPATAAGTATDAPAGAPGVAAPSSAPTAAADSAVATPAATPAVAAPGAPPRLLLVEDNPVNLLVAQKLLSVLGHGCDTAANGQIALEKLADSRYDLVFMDCQMPVLDGYSATRRWREREAATGAPRLPIVAMTANAMAGDRQRCLDAGMDDYLSKPVAREQLDAVLRRWLPRPAASPAPAVPGSTPPASPAAPTGAVPAGDAPARSTAPAAGQSAAPAAAPATPAGTPPASTRAVFAPRTSALSPAASAAPVPARPPAVSSPSDQAPRAPAPGPVQPAAPASSTAPITPVYMHPPAAPAPRPHTPTANAPAAPATPPVAPARPAMAAGTAPPTSGTPAPMPTSLASPALPASTAPAPAPEAPVLDLAMLDELRQIAGDDAAVIVNLFLEDAPRLVRQLEQASATPDLDAMREAAHALKSSSANVGALALSAAARRIEAGARAHALERPAVAVALLIAEFSRARVALQNWVAGGA